MTDGLETELREKGRAIREKIAQLRKLRAEQDLLLEELDHQAQLMDRGIDPQQVQNLGYDPARDKRGRNQVPVWNYAILKDGSRVNFAPLSQTRRTYEKDA